MAFLGKILGMLVGPALSWLAEFAAKVFANLRRRKEIKNEAQTQAAQDTEKLNATGPNATAQQMETAIDDAAKHM